jgi:hypothetical protein
VAVVVYDRHRQQPMVDLDAHFGPARSQAHNRLEPTANRSPAG